MATSDDKDDRKARLARQLRANLARRKTQARAKRAGEPDTRPDGVADPATGTPPSADDAGERD